MPTLFTNEDEAEHYLQMIGDWVDPNPAPLVVEHEVIHVVRDDLLEVGTKARAADYLIGYAPEHQNVKEWVYASPATGYAQVSLSYVCKRYGKKAVIFNAKRQASRYTEFQKRGMSYGGIYHHIDNGMYSVVNARARDYVNVDPVNRRLLPMGLNSPYALACLIKTMRSILWVKKPQTIWSVFSSGTLTRALQLSFPQAVVHAVHAGGHTGNYGQAHMHTLNMRFDQKVKKAYLPPFPSPPSYDAKAWMVMKQWYENNPHTFEADKPIMFWNVAA